MKIPGIKSREEKRLRHRMQVNQAMSIIKQHLDRLDHDRREFIADARMALQEGLAEQYKLAFGALKATMQKAIYLKQVYLELRVAARGEEQMHAYSKFCGAMGSLSKSMASLFKASNVVETQRNFTRAWEQATTLESQMHEFTRYFSHAVVSGTGLGESESELPDADIERLIRGEAKEQEEQELGLDREIEQGLEEIRQLRDQG